jgi:hypothetical protein
VTVAPRTLSTTYLRLATAILDGQITVPRVNAPRVACWIARRGLEALVEELLTSKSVDVGTGNMRSQLICVADRYAEQPWLVATVTTAWDQLSLACHHHAYELAPTSHEAREVVNSLHSLVGSLGVEDSEQSR